MLMRLKQWEPGDIDALLELVNIGVGRASGALSELATAEIKLAVPELVVADKSTLAAALGQEMAGQSVTVSQKFTGKFSGTATLVFLEQASRQLVEIILGNLGETTVTPDLEGEALEEIGNIVINSCLGAVADMLEIPIAIDLPLLFKGDAVRSVLSGDGAADWEILLVSVHLSSEPEGIGGLIVLSMSPTETEKLWTCLREYCCV